MTAEALRALLCRLCAVERGGFEPPAVADADVEALARLAAAQGVGGWLAGRLADSYADWGPTPRLLRLLRPHVLAVLSRNAVCIGVAWRVVRLLRGHGVGCVALKGVALVGTAYPDAAMRAIGDVDILVPGPEVRLAREILVADGAEEGPPPRRPAVVDSWRDHLEGLTYRGVGVELHHKLSRSDGGASFLGDVARYVESGEMVDTLSPDAHFCYLCAHARKHWLRGQSSLKWMLDLAVMLAARDDAAAFVRGCLALAPSLAREVRWAVSVAAPLVPERGRAVLRSGGFALRETVPAGGGWRVRLSAVPAAAADAAGLLAHAWSEGDGALGGWRNVGQAVRHAFVRKQKIKHR